MALAVPAAAASDNSLGRELLQPDSDIELSTNRPEDSNEATASVEVHSRTQNTKK